MPGRNPSLSPCCCCCWCCECSRQVRIIISQEREREWEKEGEREREGGTEVATATTIELPNLICSTAYHLHYLGARFICGFNWIGLYSYCWTGPYTGHCAGLSSLRNPKMPSRLFVALEPSDYLISASMVEALSLTWTCLGFVYV